MKKPGEIIAETTVFIIFWGGWALTGYFSVMSLVSFFSFELGKMVMYFVFAIVISAVIILFIEQLKKQGFQISRESVSEYPNDPGTSVDVIEIDALLETPVHREEIYQKIGKEVA